MSTTPRPESRRLYLNLVLTVIAGLLAVHTLGGGRDGVAWAQAQQAPPAPDPGIGLISSGDQRMLAELRTQNARLEHIEAMLSKGLSVKVTEMPPAAVPADRERKGK